MKPPGAQPPAGPPPGGAQPPPGPPPVGPKPPPSLLPPARRTMLQGVVAKQPDTAGGIAPSPTQTKHASMRKVFEILRRGL